MTGGLRLLRNLLLCSDTHEAAPQAGATVDALCWLHAGDFYLNKDIASADEEMNAQYADTIGALEGGVAYHWFRNGKLPIYAVRGNHDGHDAWGFFRTAQDVSGRAVRIAPGLLLAGIGWYGRHYNDLPTENDFERPCMAVANSIRRLRQADDMLILLSHYPAYPPPGEKISSHTFRRLRDLVAATQPAVFVQGHIHEWAGTCYEAPLGERRLLVVNPGPIGGVLTTDTVTLARVFSGGTIDPMPEETTKPEVEYACRYHPPT